jgi:hypothetical protein
MSYFLRFPLLRYTSNNTVTITSDVLKRVAVNQKTKENLVLFDEYDIQEGETPETVSYKFYETTDYHWVILIVNDILDPRYGWPLKGDELYEYTAAKYGSGNVNAVHHYTISETNDIIVDPTQPLVTKTAQFYNNFPDNVDYLFDYAANGTIDLTLTNGQRSFIDYLQRRSDDPLPNLNVALAFRIGDVDHSYRTSANSSTITTLDSSAFTNLALGNEINPNPTGETYNYSFIRTYIKPYVDNWYENPLSVNSSPPYKFGNVTGLNNLGIVQVSETYSPFKHYKSSTGNLYAISSTLSANVLNYAQGNLSLNLTALNNYISRTAGGYTTWGLSPSIGESAYYLRGDITRSTFFSGRLSQGGNPSTELDGNVALTFQRGLLPETSSYYDTTLNLLIAMNGNTTIKTALSDSKIAVFGETTTYPYANAFEVTNISHETNINESKRRIRILKAEYLSAFVTEFERLINV